MKKHRKQMVDVGGQKQLVDVPVDDELYKADNRAEYLRVRSKVKDISFDETVFTDLTANVVEDYEESQLLDCLDKAVKALNEKERRLIEYLYYKNLTEREVAVILGISHQAVNKQRHRIIVKLRENLSDWL
jgi:RNA polymerase sigma factor (sigma-70 family)